MAGFFFSFSLFVFLFFCNLPAHITQQGQTKFEVRKNDFGAQMGTRSGAVEKVGSAVALQPPDLG